jgi:hypothetical protein
LLLLRQMQVLPRIKRAGYNAIQLMAVQVNARDASALHCAAEAENNSLFLGHFLG